MDGGLSDSIPYKKAFEDGCDRVVVVLTREEGYRKVTSKGTKAIAKYYRKYLKLEECLLTRAERYNKSLEELKEYEKSGKVIVIRPDNTQGFSRLERDQEKIKALYADGFNKGTIMADKIKQFFADNE